MNILLKSGVNSFFLYIWDPPIIGNLQNAFILCTYKYYIYISTMDNICTMYNINVEMFFLFHTLFRI